MAEHRAEAVRNRGILLLVLKVRAILLLVAILLPGAIPPPDLSRARIHLPPERPLHRRVLQAMRALAPLAIPIFRDELPVATVKEYRRKERT